MSLKCCDINFHIPHPRPSTWNTYPFCVSSLNEASGRDLWLVVDRAETFIAKLVAGAARGSFFGEAKLRMPKRDSGKVWSMCLQAMWLDSSKIA